MCDSEAMSHLPNQPKKQGNRTGTPAPRTGQKFPTTPPNTQAESDQLHAKVDQKQQQALHRGGKSGKFKGAAQPDGPTAKPAEEGGIANDDLA